MTFLVKRLAAKICGLLSLSVATPSVSHACSLLPDYDGPRTNLELVEQSDLIFVGKLVKSIGSEEFEREILVEPQTLLKGRALPKSAKIRGFLSDRTLIDGGKHLKIRASPGNPFDIWRPHPDVWMGGCSRYTFNQGALVVLFFKNEGGSLQWFNPAFARGSEDVLDAKALWVRAVKLYANVLQLPKQARAAALKDQIEKLRDEADRNNNELLADDIERQLAGCGPVPDFGLNDKICGSPKWVYNIANAQYYRGISRPVEAGAAP